MYKNGKKKDKSQNEMRKEGTGGVGVRGERKQISLCFSLRFTEIGS